MATLLKSQQVYGEDQRGKPYGVENKSERVWVADETHGAKITPTG